MLNILKRSLQLFYLTGAELSAARWIAVSLLLSLVQSFEPLETFDLDFVNLLRCVKLRNADSGGSELCIGTQLQSYGLFCLELTLHICSFLPWRVTLLSPLLSSSTHAPSERRMTRCMCPLCCFACCQTGNGPWQADSWLPCCPPWSAVICCTVSHSHRGSQCGHWRAILDWNSSVPLSNQTSSTLKVNKNPERNTGNIRAADPLFVCRPRWKYTWCECGFIYLDFQMTLICPLRCWDDYGLENGLNIFYLKNHLENA